ncbi:DUF7127 family protein [Natrinema marinum]|uniref:DUF7127 family protein n=1 Tax=Natrinema marinum TaxID=2961598 RepID=UPI0020C89248|nr:hypothetical protein [Natrinema marinum]
METPSELQSVAGSQDEITISNREYDDECLIAVDFGPISGESSVDVVGGTAIVTVDERQFEFDLPPDATDITLNRGVLTING